jgi:PAS domain-containing protein
MMSGRAGHSEVIYLLDKVGRVVGWPSRSERTVGRRKADWHISRFYTADAREAGDPERDICSALDGGFDLEGWRLREDGSRFWARVIMSPFEDHLGKVLGLVLFMSPLGDQAGGTQRWTLPSKLERRKK